MAASADKASTISPKEVNGKMRDGTRVFSEVQGHRECSVDIRRYTGNTADHNTPEGHVVINNIFHCDATNHEFVASDLMAAIELALNPRSEDTTSEA